MYVSASFSSIKMKRPSNSCPIATRRQTGYLHSFIIQWPSPSLDGLWPALQLTGKHMVTLNSLLIEGYFYWVWQISIIKTKTCFDKMTNCGDCLTAMIWHACVKIVKCLWHLKFIAAGINVVSFLKICNPSIVKIMLFQQNFILKALLVHVLVFFEKILKVQIERLSL